MEKSSSPWILHSFKKDFLFLVLPPLLMLTLSFSITTEGIATLFFSFFTFSIVDNGHVYMTFLRTYSHTPERSSSIRYLLTPLLVFFIFFLWLWLGGRYFWHFVVYATLFHNIRQFYGITRWYQKKNKNFSPWPGRFLYALTILPVIAYHFRDQVLTGMYAETDIFYNPNPQYLLSISFIYLFILFFWLSFELFSFYTKQKSLGRFLSLLTPVTAYGISFFFGKTYLQVLGPVIIGHGISYAALMAFALNKTQSERYFSFKRTFIFLMGIAIIFGILESFSEDYLSLWIESVGKMESIPLIGVALISLYLTPLFCHYYFDGYLWKSSHREAKIIYN